MNVLAFDGLSFILVGLASLFLIGELLVKARGGFFVLGFIFITLYFMIYLDPSMVLTMSIIYFLGVILIFVDGQFINEGFLAGIGGLLMIISVGLSSPNWVVGLYAIIGVVIGGALSFLWLKWLPKRNMWTKITLVDSLTDDLGYSSMNVSYKGLIGEEGVCITDMRPIGTIKVKGNQYSAISNGHWIKKDTTIVVKQVDGTRILVEPAE
ncbi:hypothetical protein SAMN05421734_103270 [Pelagirhabdus alkalitolerans]|uniref:NfeD-like C-terminal domain-containing protein n=2 Tax=Pelagirhabdus alkalitolerans TaxID=1612202 RepID=A0A1G6HXR9_9BACI|nr:NfeD family protein [Pelagirhabdus alkalitolerans]SDB98938.1 hypothetical protein SAMN05421734_103270 [Pelagirhabdus alkalitolerans]